MPQFNLLSVSCCFTAYHCCLLFSLKNHFPSYLFVVLDFVVFVSLELCVFHHHYSTRVGLADPNRDQFPIL